MAKGGGTSPSKKRHFEEYRKNNTRDKNKIKKLLTYLKKNPNNIVAITRLRELQSKYGFSNRA